MCTTLYDHLINAYAVPQRNCPTGPGRTPSLKIDDENTGDVHLGFCQIHATFADPEAANFTLELYNAPHDATVQELIAAHGGQFKADDQGATIVVPLNAKNAALIRQLAKAIRRVVGRGRRYPVPNWKWICPRTAASLERLADHLAAFRQGQSG
jgi:hypothetical protein